jgi:hypothetical protein
MEQAIKPVPTSYMIIHSIISMVSSLDALLIYAVESVALFLHQSFHPDGLSSSVSFHLFYFVLTVLKYFLNIFILNMIYPTANLTVLYVLKDSSNFEETVKRNISAALILLTLRP